MMKRALPFLSGLGLLIWLCLPQSAAAHPLGNFTVNHYSRIEIAPARVVIVYVLDMAEIPTFQELRASDQDLTTDAAARNRYAAQQAERIRSQLDFRLDGALLPLTTDALDLTFPTGQADLKTLRLTAYYSAALHGTSERTAAFRDNSDPERTGWREIVIRALPGVALLDSSAPTEDVSNELRNYPNDLLQSPLNRQSANFRFAPGEGSVRVAAPALPVGGVTDAAFAALINQDLSALPVVLLAFAAAFVFGAAHALTPGHGKTLVAAYLVGSRGTVRHALALGTTVTLTHTASVFALGFVTLFASRFILPERLYPVLSIATGLLVVVMGGALLRQRVRQLRGRWRNTRWSLQGARAGVTPAPSAPSAPSGGNLHEHDDGTVHSHGLFGAHSHALPTGEDDAPVHWRGLVGLGISGGILPCPSALIVMLSAISLHRVGFGIALILAFSLGLAAVLMGIGMLFVLAGRLVGRFSAPRGRLLLLLPVASALGVTLLGLAMTATALIAMRGGGPV